MGYKEYQSVPVRSSEITPEHLYLNRRQFLKAAGIVSASAALLAACGLKGSNLTDESEQLSTDLQVSSTVDELGDSLTAYESVINYNNFYEFTTDKSNVAKLSKDFKTSPWMIDVGGLVHNPKTYGLEDLLDKFAQEERVYRLRCVEAWSMVLPWLGFELGSLIKEVEPMGSAKYVRFETLLDREQMPGLKSPFYPWPYTEGLRLDEAMHPLTILSTGLYGKTLLPQSGSPIRLVVPWKYGFKSIKSIVKIELVEVQPTTLWNAVAPKEYGFYSNVNPEVDHPRWSQATERRIGEVGRRETLMFNGYAEDVSGLYEGMDLSIYY